MLFVLTTNVNILVHVTWTANSLLTVEALVTQNASLQQLHLTLEVSKDPQVQALLGQKGQVTNNPNLLPRRRNLSPGIGTLMSGL